MPTPKHALDVEGTKVEVSNLDRVMYPKTGFTKAQLIQYYIGVAPVLLPHMAGRPVSMKRYPEGVEGEFFFQKQAPEKRPAWLKTAPVPSETRGKPIDYIVCDDLPTLVWLANAADLELHTFMHRAPKLATPTMMVFDLDPGAPADVTDCAQVALWLRDDLEVLGLESFAKVSGGKGLQMHVPVNTPCDYQLTGALSNALARILERDHPDKVTSIMSKERRGGKVFIDWSQNNEHKTTVCVYSLRAQPTPSVAAPVTWDEVRHGAESKDAVSLRFSPEQVLQRVEELGDLMAPVLKLKQKLPTGTG